MLDVKTLVFWFVQGHGDSSLVGITCTTPQDKTKQRHTPDGL